MRIDSDGHRSTAPALTRGAWMIVFACAGASCVSPRDPSDGSPAAASEPAPAEAEAQAQQQQVGPPYALGAPFALDPFAFDPSAGDEAAAAVAQDAPQSGTPPGAQDAPQSGT